jgi:hypothetical protein
MMMMMMMMMMMTTMMMERGKETSGWTLRGDDGGSEDLVRSLDVILIWSVKVE